MRLAARPSRSPSLYDRLRFGCATQLGRLGERSLSLPLRGVCWIRPPFSPQPTPVPDTSLIANGLDLFISIDCGAHHIQQHTTAASVYMGQSSVTYFPYTDSQLCDMGGGLADGISQANSAPPRCWVLGNG
jgi:hypothetical protein